MRYKYLITFIVSVLFCLGMMMSGKVYEKTMQEKRDQKKAAAKSIDHLKILPSQTHEMLGLKSSDVKESTYGEPLNVYMITLDSLDNFKEGDDPERMILDTKKLMIPVYYGEKLLTSVTMKGDKAEWEIAEIGGKEIHLLEPARSKLSRTSKKGIDSYFVIRIPGMYLTFLGYSQDSQLYLIPTHSHPDFELQLNKGIPAEKVLLMLKRSVNKYRRVLDNQKG